MFADWLLYACFMAAIASGLVAGVFLTFSDFVMRSLIAAHPEGGIEAMQNINRTVYRSVFLALFMAMAPVSVALAIYASLAVTGAAATWIITGAAIYVISVFLITIVCNVPMNRRLDRMDHAARETIDYWRIYGSVWTRWNHVRTIGSLATSVCFVAASIALTH
ncbi:MAG: anthrone oxygenase family protein [Pseudomonadota bacterium]